MFFTCRAVVLHLTDKDTETMFGSPPHAEAQPAIHTFVHGDGMEVLAVISTLQIKHESQCWCFYDATEFYFSVQIKLHGFLLHHTQPTPHRPQES